MVILPESETRHSAPRYSDTARMSASSDTVLVVLRQKKATVFT